MVAKFLDHNKGSLGNHEGNGKENGEKSNKFILVKQQLCTCITLFCTFFSCCCTTVTCAHFTEQVNTTQKVSFSFSKLTYGPVRFNPENFSNIWQMKWNWIRSMKFETVRIYFLSEFPVSCHPKLLLPRRRDVTTSPVYSWARCDWQWLSIMSFQQ